MPRDTRARVEQRDVGGWLKNDLRLYVGGRDRTKTVHGLRWQIDAVTAAMEGAQVPIHAALSFTGAEWPLLFKKPFRIDGVLITWTLKLAELVAADGPLTADDIDRVARHLSERFPPSSDARDRAQTAAAKPFW